MIIDDKTVHTDLDDLIKSTKIFASERKRWKKGANIKILKCYDTLKEELFVSALNLKYDGSKSVDRNLIDDEETDTWCYATIESFDGDTLSVCFKDNKGRERRKIVDK